MITINDYAKQHGISYQAVSQQVARYKAELEGHITKQGKTRYLDDHAVEFLNERRMLSTLVITEKTTVSRSARLEEENSNLKDKIIALQEHIQSVQNEMKQLQDKQILMIEDKHKELDQVRTAAEQKISEADSRFREAESRAMAAEQRSAILEAELNALKLAAEQKPKGFFARLFGI